MKMVSATSAERGQISAMVTMLRCKPLLRCNNRVIEVFQYSTGWLNLSHLCLYVCGSICLSVWHKTLPVYCIWGYLKHTCLCDDHYQHRLSTLREELLTDILYDLYTHCSCVVYSCNMRLPVRIACCDWAPLCNEVDSLPSSSSTALWSPFLVSLECNSFG